MDKKTNLIKTDKNFSSIKDNAKRQGSCYDNCCAAVIAREAKLLHLKTTLDFNTIKNKIKEKFWIAEYFRDTEEKTRKNAKKDTQETVYVAGDANTFPFWFHIFTEKEMGEKAIKAVQKEKLETKFPLKYTSFIPNNFFFPLSLLAPNYEGNTIWAHMGLCYIDVVARTNKALARKYLKEYEEQIKVHKTFLELYDAEGNPYKSFFYITDEGMLWASKWLALKKAVL